MQVRDRAHTKIVATVGPACSQPGQLAALADAGVSVFRLNMAHGRRDEHTRVFEALRELGGRRDSPVAILVDLPGPKIRLGELAADPVDCRRGDEVRFIRGTRTTQASDLVTTYEPLLDELAPGNRVMLVDGLVRLEVVEVTPEAARCRVLQGGQVRSRQGVNLPGVKLSVPALGAEDREHAAWAGKMGADFVGLSFVRAAEEIHELKAFLAGMGAATKVVAKIEKQEALDRLDAIVRAADAVMVARGDLGVEIDIAQMAAVQKRIVALCNQYSRPVIIATQMLDSMQRSRQPTRAEATDVANAILDGCDACMLSGETAVGEHPVAVVEMMQRIAQATEPLLRSEMPPPWPENLALAGLKPTTEAIVHGADRIARRLAAPMIVVVSHSGATAVALSKRRATAAIIGTSDQPESLRQMCLVWGVVPLANAPTSESRSLLQYVEQWGLRNGALRAGQFIVLVAGHGLASAGHNMVRVQEVQGAYVQPD